MHACIRACVCVCVCVKHPASAVVMIDCLDLVCQSVSYSFHPANEEFETLLLLSVAGEYTVLVGIQQ